MRIKPEETDRICNKLFATLKSKQLIQPKVPEEKIIKKMVDIFQKNLQEEEQINREAENMLKKIESQASGQDIDRRKMLLMIRKQLAKEKGFIL